MNEDIGKRNEIKLPFLSLLSKLNKNYIYRSHIRSKNNSNKDNKSEIYLEEFLRNDSILTIRRIILSTTIRVYYKKKKK